MHRLLKKVLDVGVEEAIRIVWVALGGIVVTTVALWWAHHKSVTGVWVDRGVTALITLLVVLVISGALAVVPRLKARTSPLPASGIVGRKGWLDRRVEWQKAQKAFIATLAQLAGETKSIGNVYTASTKRIKSATRKPQAETFAFKMHAISRRTAARLDKCSARLDRIRGRLQAIANPLTENQLADLKWTLSQSSQRTEGNLTALSTAIGGFQERNRAALAANRSWIGSLTQFESPTQEFDAASQRLILILGDVTEVMEAIDRHSTEMLATVDEAKQSISGTAAPPSEGA